MDAPAHVQRGSAAHDPPHPVRGLVAVALAALRTRLDLAAVEFELYALSLARLLVWVAGALACLLLGLVFALVAVVVALWDTHRMLALLGGSALFIVAGLVLGFVGVRTMRARPGLLEGSLQQLAEDQRRAGVEP
jgi:uncharacterized membrane protein YqjE